MLCTAVCKREAVAAIVVRWDDERGIEGLFLLEVNSQHNLYIYMKALSKPLQRL